MVNLFNSNFLKLNRFQIKIKIYKFKMQGQNSLPSPINLDKYVEEQKINMDSSKTPMNIKLANNTLKEKSIKASQQIKMTIVGDPGVGCRSLHLRFSHKAFIQNPRKWNFRIRIFTLNVSLINDNV